MTREQSEQLERDLTSAAKILSGVWVLLALVGLVAILAGCSHGLQEVGFAIPDAKDGVHHIVTRDVVSSRISANQPHPAGQFHCTSKVSSVEMAELRRDGNDHTWYRGCRPISEFPQHQYVMTSDQSWATVWQAPLSALALSGGLVGMAALWPEDRIIQNGGGANAQGGNAIGQGGAGGRGGSASVQNSGPYRGGYRW